VTALDEAHARLAEQAAAECGVSQPTASRYYRRFRAATAPAARG
jgi:DNA-binding MurR/RpiR family transcriptional regulator